MGYIRSNEDWERANGTYHSTKSLASDLAWKHTPDSIKEEIRRDLKDRGYSASEIAKMENEE